MYSNPFLNGEKRARGFKRARARFACVFCVDAALLAREDRVEEAVAEDAVRVEFAARGRKGGRVELALEARLRAPASGSREEEEEEE